MEKSLYPLKFTPIYKTPIWGGNGFKTKLHRTNAPEKCGESWEISGVKDNVSVVCNGFLAGNDLSELLEVYMGDLVGDSVYEKFGNDFPLLIKFIDANDKLSVQVHPDDDLAAEKHNSYGKTEMWYVLEAEKDANVNGINLPDTPFYHYCMQQNLYRYMLETHYGIKVRGMNLVVLCPDYPTYFVAQVPKMDEVISQITAACHLHDLGHTLL